MWMDMPFDVRPFFGDRPLHFILTNSLASQPPGTYKVLTSLTHRLNDELQKSIVFRVNTGGPLPAGADSVIMVEDTELVSTTKDANGEDIEEDEVKTLVQVPPEENVRQPGSDVRKGDLVMPLGEVITSVGGEVGTLAFVGRKEVSPVTHCKVNNVTVLKQVTVFRKPVVALLSTGNELLDLQSPRPISGDDWGGVWDTNRPSLQTALEGMGYEVVDLGIVADR